MNLNPFEASSIVWPLLFLLIFLLLLKQVRDDVRPIFRGIVGGLAVQSQKNATTWALGLAIATLGSMQALVDVAHEMKWPYLEACARIASPFLAGLVGYAMKSPMSSQNGLQLAPAPSNVPPQPNNEKTPS